VRLDFNLLVSKSGLAKIVPRFFRGPLSARAIRIIVTAVSVGSP
jgi:hypothetical protein